MILILAIQGRVKASSVNKDLGHCSPSAARPI
jgi:hypothetical protein